MSTLCFFELSNRMCEVELDGKPYGVLKRTAGIWRYQGYDEKYDEYGGVKYSRDLKEAEEMMWEKTQKCDDFFAALGL